MYNFLHERNLIYKYQSGFQPGHSTVYQIIEIYDNICKALEKKEYMCMFFFDISKAFDRVWYDGLIHKINNYGFRYNLCDWLKSYLHNRKQRIVINNKHSSFLPVKAGVPQGSVLGPLLFLLYINDICDNLRSSTRLFADDSSIIATSPDIPTLEENVNADLVNLSKWASDWLVTFNPNKTEVMFFTNRPFIRHPNIIFDGEHPDIVDSHKHLGVFLSSNAKWDIHIDHIIKRCAKMIGVLRKLKMNISRKCLNQMFLSYIKPILEYADVVWDGCSIDNTDRLERIQLEAARIVTGLTRSTHLERLYSEVGWFPLSQHRKERKLTTLYKIIHGLAPSYLTDLLPQTIASNLGYNLRNRQDYIEPRCRLELYKRSFFPSSISLWNSLQIEIRAIDSLNSFKKVISKEVSKVPSHYLSGERKWSVVHARIRNGCSNLNNDLQQNHLSFISTCICGYSSETPLHYLLECKIFDKERADMFRDLTFSSLPSDLHSLLYGSTDLTHFQNELLFEIVQRYIKEKSLLVKEDLLYHLNSRPNTLGHTWRTKGGGVTRLMKSYFDCQLIKQSNIPFLFLFLLKFWIKDGEVFFLSFYFL